MKFLLLTFFKAEVLETSDKCINFVTICRGTVLSESLGIIIIYITT